MPGKVRATASLLTGAVMYTVIWPLLVKLRALGTFCSGVKAHPITLQIQLAAKNSMWLSTCHVTFLVAATLHMNFISVLMFISNVTMFMTCSDLWYYTTLYIRTCTVFGANGAKITVCTVEMRSPTIFGGISVQTNKHCICTWWWEPGSTDLVSRWTFPRLLQLIQWFVAEFHICFTVPALFRVQVLI